MYESELYIYRLIVTVFVPGRHAIWVFGGSLAFGLWLHLVCIDVADVEKRDGSFNVIIIFRGGRGDFAGHNTDEIQEPLVVQILAVFFNIFFNEIEFAFHHVVKAFTTHVFDVRCEHLSLEPLEFEAILGQRANLWNSRREV